MRVSLEVEQLGALFGARMGGLVAIDLAVVGQQQLPIALDTPAEQQRGLGIVDVGDVVREAFAEDGIAIDGLGELINPVE